MIDNIFLIRHGESTANVDKSVHSHTADHAIPLSEKGNLQALEAGKKLDAFLDVNLEPHLKIGMWISPYQRTRETANNLRSQLGSQNYIISKEHPLLCEQQFGLFDGIPDEELPIRFPAEHAHYELAAKFGGKFWARMPLGESRFDVCQRVHQIFGTFHRDADRHNIRNLIVVAHGTTLRAFTMMWLHLPYEWFEAEPNPGNCSIRHIQNNRDMGYL